jgi:hypothetical protein
MFKKPQAKDLSMLRLHNCHIVSTSNAYIVKAIYS